MKKGSRQSLAKAVNKSTRVPVSDAYKTISEFFSVVENYLVMGNKVQIRGHFTLCKKARKARIARNPKTGEVFFLPVRKTATAKFPKGYL